MKLVRLSIMAFCVLAATLGPTGSVAAKHVVTQFTAVPDLLTFAVLDPGTCTPTGQVYHCVGTVTTYRIIASDPRVTGWATWTFVRDLWNPQTGYDTAEATMHFVSDEGGVWEGTAWTLPFGWTDKGWNRVVSKATGEGQGLYASLSMKFDSTPLLDGNWSFAGEIVEK